jgi:hypothetical protein
MSSASGQSNFGCKPLGFGMLLKKGSEVIGPDFKDSTYKASNEDTSKKQIYFYTING